MADIREDIELLIDCAGDPNGYLSEPKLSELRYTMEALLTQNELLLSAHVAISKGVGAYSQDQLTNAGNTIDSMMKIADKAIADCNE